MINYNKVCIIGVGYVGETLLNAFSNKYIVYGYDTSKTRVQELKSKFVYDSSIMISNNEEVLENAGLYCISVPTLLTPDQTIDDTYIKDAIMNVSKFAEKGSSVVIESSVSVGMTRKLTKHLHEKGVYIGFSPERIDPGREIPTVDKIPKIIAGYDLDSLKHVRQYYSDVFSKIVPVSSLETAEMCKLYENCFRMVNIAYVNEIADACKEHGINEEEMFKACSTKPYGFMSFHPGLGVGGHCIPVNPYYLFVNNKLPLLKHATELTLERPWKKATKINDSLSLDERILVVGVSFKPGQKLITNSPAYEFAKVLEEKGRTINIYDPLVDSCDIQMIKENQWNASFLNENYDVIVIAMKQHNIDYNILKKYTGRLIYANDL